MKKHLIVVSIDAMVFEDIEYCKTLPNFSKILDGAAIIERVRTIYPSLTHPVHATLLTGVTAGKHGAVSNSIFNPTAPDMGNGIWFNHMKELRVETIFHAAKRRGLSTAAASWPMTSGGDRVIDYLVPSALNSDFEGFENPLDAYRALGAGDNVMDIIEEGVRRYGWENKHPEVDEFQIYCTAEIIKRYKPELILTHPSYVDSKRHATGVFGEGVLLALRETDRWLGILLDAVAEAGIKNETDIVLLSDHGQISITRTFSPNVAFAEAGLIKADESGKITEWQAYAKSTGASAQVYVKDPTDRALVKQVEDILLSLVKPPECGVGKILTAAEVKEKYGLYGDFSFVIETDGETSFGEWLTAPAKRGLNITDYRFGRGTHGHEPDKGPQPTFIGKGPSFKSGAVLENGSILNHAPTLARVLGLELDEAEGRAVTEILN